MLRQQFFDPIANFLQDKYDHILRTQILDGVKSSALLKWKPNTTIADNRFVTLREGMITLAYPGDFILGVSTGTYTDINGDKLSTVVVLGAVVIDVEQGVSPDSYISIGENGIGIASQVGYRILERDLSSSYALLYITPISQKEIVLWGSFSLNDTTSRWELEVPSRNFTENAIIRIHQKIECENNSGERTFLDWEISFIWGGDEINYLQTKEFLRFNSNDLQIVGNRIEEGKVIFSLSGNHQLSYFTQNIEIL